MYDIEIDYHTGNTFESYDTTDCLGGEWTLDVAKENLKRIQAHYRAYSDRNGYVSCMAGKKESDLLESIKNEPWYVTVDGYIDAWQYSIMLLENDGSSKRYVCSWCGYFEHLHGGTIIAAKGNVDESGMSFTV